MDTTTVNFAINKLTEGFNKVAPSIQNVSEKYIQFVVTKTVLEFLMTTLILIVSVVSSIFFYKKTEDFNDPSFTGIATVISGVCGLLFSMAFILCLFKSTLALLNPEMFVINQIINSAK